MDRLADEALTAEQCRQEWLAWRQQVDASELDHLHILCWAVYVSAQRDLREPDVPETCVRSVAGYVRQAVGESERAYQVRLLHDVLRNPFRPVAFSADWRSDTATALAKQMHESLDFSPMPILADALQDAGWDSDDILSHCRDPQQVHVRGCWVVDLVLGKV